jgi:hypothetical protein
MELQAIREQNILDAVSLPVNRLAFKRILSAGWQSDVGGLSGNYPKELCTCRPCGINIRSIASFFQPGP